MYLEFVCLQFSNCFLLHLGLISALPAILSLEVLQVCSKFPYLEVVLHFLIIEHNFETPNHCGDLFSILYKFLLFLPPKHMHIN